MIYKSYLEFLKKYENEYIENNIFKFIKKFNNNFKYKEIKEFKIDKKNFIFVKYQKNDYLNSFLKEIGYDALNLKSEKILNKSIKLEYMNFLENLYECNEINKNSYKLIVQNLDNIKTVNDLVKYVDKTIINNKKLQNTLNFKNFNDNEIINYRKYIINSILIFIKTNYPDIKIELKKTCNFNYNTPKILNNLFNKYILNIRKPTEPINYDLIKREEINKKIICHIHCYDIDKFNDIFGIYINNLEKYFSVIITFSIGNNIPKNDATILKIENRGVDIGAKICCLKYIQDEKQDQKQDQNIEFTNILFLHSKTDKKKRLEYFNPLIGSEDIIIKNIDLLQENNAIFNNIHQGYDLTPEYISNRYYHNEILEFLNVKYKNEMEYPEGNCMYLSKKIVDFIYTSNLHLFYNILNTKNDFDVSWIKGRYGKSNVCSEKLYEDFKNNSNYMDLNKNGKAVGNNFGNFSNDMPDGMIEHIFERIYINVIKHLDLKYIVVQ